MAKQDINLGTPNGKDGDLIRDAFNKVNQNFNELYALTSGTVEGLTELAQDYAATMFTSGTHTGITVTYNDDNNQLNLAVDPLDLSAIDQSIIPDTDVTYDLGSATNRFRDLYLSGSSIDLGGTVLSVVGGQLQIGGTNIADVVASGIDYNQILNTPTIPTLGNISFSANNITNTIGDIINIQAPFSQLLSTDGAYIWVEDGYGAGIEVNSNIWKFDASGGITFPDATVQTTAWTGNTPGLTFTNGVQQQLSLTADIFDFGTSNTIDMQNCSVLLTGATVTGLDTATITASALNLNISARNYVYVDSNEGGSIVIGQGENSGSVVVGKASGILTVNSDAYFNGDIITNSIASPATGNLELDVGRDNGGAFIVTAWADKNDAENGWKQILWAYDTNRYSFFVGGDVDTQGSVNVGQNVNVSNNINLNGELIVSSLTADNLNPSTRYTTEFVEFKGTSQLSMPNDAGYSQLSIDIINNEHANLDPNNITTAFDGTNTVITTNVLTNYDGWFYTDLANATNHRISGYTDNGNGTYSWTVNNIDLSATILQLQDFQDNFIIWNPSAIDGNTVHSIRIDNNGNASGFSSFEGVRSITGAGVDQWNYLISPTENGSITNMAFGYFGEGGVQNILNGSTSIENLNIGPLGTGPDAPLIRTLVSQENAMAIDLDISSGTSGNVSGNITIGTGDVGTKGEIFLNAPVNISSTINVSSSGVITTSSTDKGLVIEGPLTANMVPVDPGNPSSFNTVSNGVNIRTYRIGDDLERNWTYSWDGALYPPYDANSTQVGAIEWRNPNFYGQIKSTPGYDNEFGSEPASLKLLTYNTPAGGAIIIQPGGDTAKWIFDKDSSLTFPDATVQTTAWAGGRVVTPPATSAGASGDTEGDIAFNGNYIYYCTTAYSGPSEVAATNYFDVTDGNGHYVQADVTTPSILGTGSLSVTNVMVGGVPSTEEVTSYELISGSTYRFFLANTAEPWNTLSTSRLEISPNIWKRVAWSSDTW